MKTLPLRYPWKRCGGGRKLFAFFFFYLSDISSVTGRILPFVFSLYNIILCLNNLEGEIQPDAASIPSGKYSYIFLNKLVFRGVI